MNILIKIWFYFHCTMIFLWCWPLPNPNIGEIFDRHPVEAFMANPREAVLALNVRVLKQDPMAWQARYLSTTGLWQYWDMFAPDPSNLDVWFDALVTYRDGSTKIHQYPRMKVLSIPEKFIMERYRKYGEALNGGEYEWKWPKTCQRIALEEFHDLHNPPIKVKLRRHFRLIQPYGQPTPDAYKEFDMWEQEIDQNELVREKAE